jgi:predicted metal-dependent hydrolase
MGLMPFDWSSGALAEGLHCYRTNRFFDAHEHWEAAWLASAEPEKTFLQAIIQVAAAFHHLEKGNRPGAVSLLGRALSRLDDYPDEFGGVAVRQLRAELTAWVSALRAEPRVELLPPYPKLVRRASFRDC